MIHHSSNCNNKTAKQKGVIDKEARWALAGLGTGTRIMILILPIQLRIEVASPLSTHRANVPISTVGPRG